jgi:hypothetical protein
MVRDGAFPLLLELLSVPSSALVCVSKELKEARGSIMKRIEAFLV